MATISTLAVSLIARTAVFEKKMKRSRRSVKGFKGSLQNIGRTLKRFAGGLLAVAGAGAMLLVIKRTMKAIDVTAKLSRRLGIATEELIALQHAASIMGVEQTALNKSIDIFIRRLGEMKTGAGEATRGLELLGIDYENLINKSPLESIKLIAEEIRRLPNQAEKAAAAYFLFGRAGAQLVNLFETGAKGIEEFQREAEKLGITFNQLDAAKVEQANDAFTRIKAIVTGITQSLVIQLAPVLEAIALQFIDTGVQANIAGSIGVNAFERMAKAAKAVAAPFKLVYNALKAITGIVIKLTGIITFFVGKALFSDFIEELGKGIAKIGGDLLGESFEGIKKTFDNKPVDNFFDNVRKRARS